MLALAQRFTFVIDEGRRIVKVESGSDAIDPKGAITSCPIRKKAAAPQAGSGPGSK